MNSEIFETRKNAQRLLKEAIAIWQQGDLGDKMEGLENDPVLMLLMTAVAYQSNEMDGEISRLQEETLDELARMLAPYEMSHATPATMVVQTALQQGVTEMETDATTRFLMAEAYPFISLLKTRVMDATVGSVVRVDGRRWKVRLDFDHVVNDLGGLSFSIDGLDFRDLTVTVGKQTLPLVKPWEYAELPFNECFLPQNQFYNRGQVCSLSMLPMDLFARHNVKLFCVVRNRSAVLSTENDHVDLMFEFSGISENFPFDKSHLHLNTMVLVNAELQECVLTAQKPFDRIAGNSEDLNGRQFLHLLQPLESQLFGNTELEVRRVAADRFNQGSLVKLLSCIINKYHSDFYAFQKLKGMTTDKTIYSLYQLLRNLKEAGMEDPERNVPGIYLLLKDRSLMQNKNFSLTVKYLTTAGAAINPYLNDADKLSVPSGFDNASTRLLMPPVYGTDETDGGRDANSLLRYYMLTSDRVVTPADIKMFCLKELMNRYGLSESMISSIRVNRRQTTDRKGCGYEIVVEIDLVGNSFVKRNIESNLTTAEILIQKMLEVRNSNIYPIRVGIKIVEERKEE